MSSLPQPLPEPELQKLSQSHKDVLSLLAQGVSRQEVSGITGYTPEYISKLCRQQICKDYLQEMIAVVDFRLQAMTIESVDAIQDVLKNGANDDRIRAAKLQLEAVGKIGAGKNAANIDHGAPDHLQQLADRLVNLLKSSQPTQGAVTYENDPTSQASQSNQSDQIEDAEVLIPVRGNDCQVEGPQLNVHESFA